MNRPVDGYWCEVVARCPEAAGEWFLGGYQAGSPRLAVRWLRMHAIRLANALDPIPETCPFPGGALRATDPGNPNPGHVFREWSRDLRVQERQMAALRTGEPFTVQAGGPDRILDLYDVDIYFTLSARPMVRDFMTEWKLNESSHALA
ncbi:hypothetical protein ACFVYR_05205 [Streptomyces sp. NPDC058284]|uniref:hypothetical protein n=1 Tax=unclassified Streptomyces TaxID=2593676 RepID=UPI00365294A3